MLSWTHALSRRALLATGSVLLLAACSSDSTTEPPPPAKFGTMYLFGASLDDTGNACNLSAASCPAAPYATGRFSNGPLWPELVATQYGASVSPSRTGGTNYAYAGARTGAIAGTTQLVPNMNQQVDSYLATGSTVGRADALFVIDAATVGNDITDALVQGLSNPQAPAAIINAAVTNVTGMISRLYAGGARNFLIANSTDIGRTPLVRSQGALAIAAASALSAQFNAALAAALPGVRTASVGANIYVLDLGAFTAEVFANPTSFGFTNTTAACVVTSPPSVCTTPDAYLYWDGFHPTAATGRAISRRAITALGG